MILGAFSSTPHTWNFYHAVTALICEATLQSLICACQSQTSLIWWFLLANSNYCEYWDWKRHEASVIRSLFAFLQSFRWLVPDHLPFENPQLSPHDYTIDGYHLRESIDCKNLDSSWAVGLCYWNRCFFCIENWLGFSRFSKFWEYGVFESLRGDPGQPEEWVLKVFRCLADAQPPSLASDYWSHFGRSSWNGQVDLLVSQMSYQFFWSTSSRFRCWLVTNLFRFCCWTV